MNNNYFYPDTKETNGKQSEPVCGTAPLTAEKPQAQEPRISNHSAEHHQSAYAPEHENAWYQNCSIASSHSEKQGKPHRSKVTMIVALVLCCLLFGGMLGAGGFALGSGALFTSNTASIQIGQRENTVMNTSYVDTSKEMTASEVYAANVNSTVGITTSVTTNYFGYQTTAAASGSGFIITDSGYIVTNYHVVENAESIKVTTYDNTEYKATLIGCDESNDIAVLKIEGKNLKPVTLGDSGQMNVGDSVIAIGNPLGELTFSLTSGSISALNRKVTIDNTAMTLIQTDCAINSGNSGGALFNMHGEVIGITNAKYSGNSTGASIDNIAFAIPIDSVRELINSIIETGYIEKPYIGVTISAISEQSYGISGVVIRSVEKDGPAAKAGIQQNDIITKVNGKEVTGIGEFMSMLAVEKEGDSVTLTVYRQGETQEISVKPQLKKQSALPESDSSDQSDRSGQQNQNGQDIYGQFPFIGGGFSGGWNG